MSGRSYLSIGDVLSLLREEFPDVTISKIRFLESQGLVDPERSPSGYRKFYDQDVARLRWVLRKQRDQFLPLRVIRDRLAAAGNGVPSDDDDDPAGVEANGQGTEWHSATGSVPVGAHVAAHAAPAAREASPSHDPLTTGTATTVGSLADDAGGDDETPRPATNGAAGMAADRMERVDAPGEAQPTADPLLPARRRSEQVGDTAVAAPPETPRPPERSPLQSPGAGAHHAWVSGVSLTAAELCAASGLTPQVVASLEACGLLAPMSIAGGQFYDEEALMVAKLAEAFERFGIEPRHLRLFRNAADREVGLIEQVVAPLLRQRNPEARQRAIEAAAELAGLGQSLRAALVRSELHRQFGT